MALNFAESDAAAEAKELLTVQEELARLEADVRTATEARDEAERDANKLEEERDNALRELDRARDLLDRLATAVFALLNTGITTANVEEAERAARAGQAEKLLRGRG